MRKMNKKGFENMISWILAIFIIVFVLAIYLFFVAALSSEKFLGDDLEIKVVSSSYNDIGLLESFLSFVDENGMLFNKNPVEFQKAANDFLNENVMKEDYPVGVAKGEVKRAWIRVYDFEEKIEQYSVDDAYRQYELTRGTSKANTFPCDPDDVKNDVFLVVSGGNKIVLCVEYEDE